ncbi:hypothetical protein [Ligilactobacillus apodemi]|nr:hypothetical protein [Ligilactobacillus apodemi]
MGYEFMDTQPAYSKIDEQLRTEGIVFGDFDSRTEGWWLLERDAPSPNEKAIVETLPYMQGSYDFSVFDDERYFENRTLTYKFKVVASPYADRKMLEHEIKRKLIPSKIQRLIDTHDANYFWKGKVQSVTLADDNKYQTLVATITFNCYPFAFAKNYEGSDIWDDVEFEHWVFQEVKFDVFETQKIVLTNIGSRSAICNVEVTGNVWIKGDNTELQVNQSNYQGVEIVLARGKNYFELAGKGTIYFKFRREEMI